MQVSHEGFREIIYTIGWKIHKKQLPFAVKKDGNLGNVMYLLIIFEEQNRRWRKTPIHLNGLSNQS